MMMLSRNIFTYACFIVWEIKSEILRLPCKSYANFSAIKHDTVLQGSVIATLLFLTENQCKSKCLMERRCKSYNKENDGDMKCELNDKTPEDWKDWDVRVVKQLGWTFGSTNYSFPLLGQVCEAKNPCTEGVMCRDTCECPGYQCYPCKAGERGLRCDEIPLNGSGLVEVGAKQYGSVVVKLPNGNYKIKLVYHSGYLSCVVGSYKTKFGCSAPKHNIDRIDIIVTNNQDNVLLPKGKGYSHDGKHSNSQYVIFNDVIELRPGQQLRFWYKEDLKKINDHDNDGVSKFYAYAILQH